MPCGKQSRKTWSTIDPNFLVTLPTVSARHFPWIFPPSGPGVHVDMQRALSILIGDGNLLYSKFSSMVNQISRHQYYLDYLAYLEKLDSWLSFWPALENYKGTPPLAAIGYDGTPMKPLSAYGQVGEYNAFSMTPRLAEAIFKIDMAACHGYMQSSFQMRHDDTLMADNTHKNPKKIFVNTTGRARVQPFTTLQTTLSRKGFVVLARYKHSKSHLEVDAILQGLKNVRENAGAPTLAYVHVDNVADALPYERTWPEKLVNDIALFPPDSDLPLLEKVEHLFFISNETIDNYILSVQEEIASSSPVIGFDTEFSHGTDLTMIEISFTKLPVIVIHATSLKRMPEQLEGILSNKRFQFVARSIGTDCSMIEKAYGIVVTRH